MVQGQFMVLLVNLSAWQQAYVYYHSGKWPKLCVLNELEDLLETWPRCVSAGLSSWEGRAAELPTLADAVARVPTHLWVFCCPACQ